MSDKQVVLTETQKLKQDVAEIKIGSRGFMIENMGQLVTMLEVTLRSGLAPKGCDKLSDAIIRCQYGMSVGLDPMRALQSVYVVGGRPCLYGAAVPGLVLSSGKCKTWKIEQIGDGDQALCRVTTERNDVGGENVFEFSMKDAIAAGLPAKNPTWKSFPKDHLRHKAVARAASSIYGDLMSGFGVVEDEQDAIDVNASVTVEEATVSRLDAMAADMESKLPQDAVVVEAEVVNGDLFGEPESSFVDQG